MLQLQLLLLPLATQVLLPLLPLLLETVLPPPLLQPHLTMLFQEAPLLLLLL